MKILPLVLLALDVLVLAAALATANRKFLRRFKAMEGLAAERGLDLGKMDLDEMNGLWEEVKAGEG